MESWLTQIINYLLAQSWQIAVLTIAVALASILLRNRSAHVRYLLWLIVLAKCLVPPLYSIPVAVLPEKETPTYFSTSPITERIITEYNVPEAVTPELSKPTSVESKVKPSPVITGRPDVYNIRVWLAIGWLAGLVALSLYYLLNALRTQIWLQKQRKALSSESADNIKSIFMVNGVRHMPRIWLLDRISQPFVWGLVRGSIYLPTESIEGKRAKFQASLLGHELSHVIRLDAMINSLQVIAQTVFWFHPFVWWANRKIRDEREKCCDEMTISRFNTLPEDYGEAIVESIASKYEQSQPVPSLAIAGQAKNLEERINTMLRPGKKFYTRPSLVAAVFVFWAVLLTAPTAVVLTTRAHAGNVIGTEEDQSRLGQLEYVDHWGSSIDLIRPTSLELSPDGRHVYITAFGSRHVAVLNRDSTTGYVKGLQTIPLKGAFVIRVSPDGRYVVCSDVQEPSGSEYYAGTNSVNLFERDRSTGKLTLLDSFKQGENGIESLGYVVEAAFSPDSRFVYVVASNSDAVTGFRITDEKKLALIQSDQRLDECFDGARGITISPDGGYLYIASKRANTLTVLQRDAETGRFENKQVLRNGLGEVRGLKGIWSVTCSADGRFVYTNARGEQDEICVFTRQLDGTLKFVQEVITDSTDVDLFDGGSRLRISPDGNHLYALSKVGNSIVVFRRNSDTGRLTHLQTESLAIGFGKIGRKYIFPSDVAISPDGAYLYIAGEGSGLNGMVLLRRVTGQKIGPAYALYEAAIIGESQQLRSLIEAGAAIDALGERGYTALHWAAKENHKEAAELLLDAGADVNKKTADVGWTPLHLAVSRSNREMAEILIARGADLNAENGNNSRTPILTTLTTKDIDLAAFLLDKGARPDTREGEAWTPLHYACAAGDREFADLLVKKGVDINIKAQGGFTPLFFAISNHDIQMVEWLITKGADINAKSLHGQTLLDWAQAMYNKEAIELLKKHGAKE